MNKIFNSIKLHYDEDVERVLYNTPVVYKFTFPNGQIYVGSTKNLRKRLKDHCANCYHSNAAHDMLSVFSEAKVDIIGKYNDASEAHNVEKRYINGFCKEYGERGEKSIVNRMLYKNL